MAKLFLFAQDRLCHGRPDKGTTMGVIMPYRTVNVPNQLAHGSERASTDGLLSNEAEPALDLVEP